MESDGCCSTGDGVFGVVFLVRSSFSFSRGLCLLLLWLFHHYSISSVGFGGGCVGDTVFFPAAVVDGADLVFCTVWWCELNGEVVVVRAKWGRICCFGAPVWCRWSLCVGDGSVALFCCRSDFSFCLFLAVVRS
jgi:hypothetical protein